MKSSETTTSRAAEAASGAEGHGEGAGGHSTAKRLEWLFFGALFAMGGLVILYVNGWRITTPVLFLFIGWLGILVSISFIWKSAMAMALEDDEDDDRGFEVASTRRDDLQREKRSVLKAIKEIEFDHAMDKMSREDADELMAMYRRRAIAIIKELEGGDTGSVSEMIDREVKARLAVEGASESAARKKAKTRGREEETDAAEPAEGAGRSERDQGTASPDDAADEDKGADRAAGAEEDGGVEEAEAGAGNGGGVEEAEAGSGNGGGVEEAEAGAEDGAAVEEAEAGAEEGGGGAAQQTQRSALSRAGDSARGQDP